MQHSRLFAQILTTASVLFFSSSAFAGAAAEQKTEDGYGYEFRDDSLLGKAVGAQTPMIRLRKRGLRRTLIRPRVHFVAELLKSVENL